MKAGDLIQFKQGTFEAPNTEYIKQCGDFKYNTPYVLCYDGEGSYYSVNPGSTNKIFYPLYVVEPYEPSENQEESTVTNKPMPLMAQELDDDTRSRIKKQKGVAQELLAFSMIMDHQACVLGGAPRNWELGKLAKDIDIFVRVPNGASDSHLMHILEAFGIEGLFNLSTHKAPHVPRKHSDSRTRRNNDIQSAIHVVFEGTYMGEQVQFIFLEASASVGTSYARRHFDTSINMIAYKYNLRSGEYVVDKHPLFEDTVKTGVIFVYPNGNPYGDNDHLKRIASYFPSAPLVSHEEHDAVMRNPAHAYSVNKDWDEFDSDDSCF